MIPYLPS